jgi:hypothetical protein
MATTTILVIDAETEDGIESVKVDLEFPYGGFAGPEWTDYSGEATFYHESTGRAHLYVGGKYIGDINTPVYKTIRKR